MKSVSSIMAMRQRSTLIGIIVFLVAIAVIAALAVPAWRNHATKTHVDEALKAADGAKLVVMEAATLRGGLGRLTTGDLAYDSSSASNPYASKVTIGAGGHITVTTRDTGASPDPVLELVPAEAASTQGQAPIAWGCVVVRGDPDAMPEDCRVMPAQAMPAPAPAASAVH